MAVTIGRGLALSTMVVVTTFAGAFCASMDRKQQRAREAAEIGLVSHPEFAEIMETLRRLDGKVEELRDQIGRLNEGRAADREGHRDDMEKVLAYVGAQVEAIKAEIAAIRAAEARPAVRR